MHDDTQYLLAMALADGALYGITSVEDLWDMSIPEYDNALPLHWKDEALETPIVRNATKANGVTNIPLPKATFEAILKSVLNLSGYFGTATVHAIRRALGKKLMVSASVAVTFEVCPSPTTFFCRAIHRGPEVPAHQPK